MVVVLSRYAKVQFCPSKMFRTPVTPHETNLLLSEITVRRTTYFTWIVPTCQEPSITEYAVAIVKDNFNRKSEK